MTTREIDHLTVASLLDLGAQDRGVGYLMAGFYFEAIRNVDGLTVDISVDNPDTGFSTRIAMPLALIRQEAAADLTCYISRRIEARGALEV